MTVLEVALGVGLAITIVWGSVFYLLAVCKIEELEKEILGCEKQKPKR